MQCPVDHKKRVGACPVDHGSSKGEDNTDSSQPSNDNDEGKFMPKPMEDVELDPSATPAAEELVPENPSDIEYAKIQKIVRMMVSFYRNGAKKKEEQAEEAEVELAKVQGSLKMIDAQLEALKPFSDNVPPGIYKFADEQPTTAPVPKRNPYLNEDDLEKRKAKDDGDDGDSNAKKPVPGQDGYFAKDGTELTTLTERTPEVVMANQHPRVLEYRSKLEQEKADLVERKPEFTRRAKEYRLLHEWSLGVVRAMEWLESNMDEYCETVLKLEVTGGWKKKNKKERVVLTAEQAKEYKMGLQEVTYNLQESQDFFDASLDGRLREYLTIERDAIKAQIEAIEAFPDALERKGAVLEELKEDLESTETSLAVDRSRNEKMHDLHTDFFKVLLWQRETLQGMGIEGLEGLTEEGLERKKD